MRNAVIFTGALRTIRKTIHYFKKNVLQASIDKNIIVDVFVCVQNDGYHLDEDWNLWFKEQMGTHLISIEWFSLEKHPEWVAHRETQLAHINIDNSWKSYLRKSGSMIEYFQLQLAYMKMCNFEQVHNFKYDYVIRARTDSIYIKPIDFHWLEWTNIDIAARVDKIIEQLTRSKIAITRKSVLMYFMCTILSDDVITNIANIIVDYSANETDKILSDELTPDTIHTYISQGRYILTIRKNNLYIIRRNLFHLIPTLGTMYGFMRSPNADDYWFNAEGQFRDACYYSCVSIFDYNTLLEDRSVLSADIWNESDFFNSDGTPIHSHMLFCMIRK